MTNIENRQQDVMAPRQKKSRVGYPPTKDSFDEIERAFAPLHKRLRTLERRSNPSKQNLHFGGQLNVVPKDFDVLLELASEGLDAVRSYDAYFKKHSLYDDGMFWYDLFLLISVASLQGLTVPESVLRALVEVLVDISHYSLATGGDILKRNREALGNLLYGFPLPSIQAIARARAKQSPDVTEFVALTLGVVAKAQAHSDEEFGTTDDYCRAFKAIKIEGIADNHLALLKAHFNAPEHTATWEQLATAVGYDSFRAVNLQYGGFAERIARQLSLRDKPPDPNGDRWWLWVLVRWAEQRDPESGHTAFVLRHPVVEALQRLGIVRRRKRTHSTSSSSEGSNRLWCPQCGSFRIAAILWGYPKMDQRLQKLLAAGKVVLGGCVVSRNDAEHHCNACGFEWRTSPPKQ